LLLPLGHGLDTMDVCDTMVLAEILNVLMDIYGDDDIEDPSFHSLRVMDHFECGLAVLKQRVSNPKQTSHFVNDMVGLENESIDHMKEIAWNCERFIQYKKEYGMIHS
jgi:hypothetical protein